ncbi:MAG: cation:proton antiporter, partial [Kineosporiaceae bacterium]
SWPAAIALGAIVAPPDAVAATAVGRRIGMPRTVLTLLEGESLLNDATALVTLSMAVAALAGTPTVTDVAVAFVRSVTVGVGVGWAVAAVVTPIRRRVHDPVLDTTVSLLVPYVAMIAAEAAGGSGVLAVVLAGLILGHRSPAIQSASSRVTERTIFRTVQFVLESVVFLLIGLQLRDLLSGAEASSTDPGRIALICLAVVATVIVVRIAWVFPATYLPRLIPAVARADPVPPWRAVAVLSWAGMRGVVTLAAAFTLTGTDDAAILIVAAFAVVVVSLLVQGATLPALVRRLGVRGPDPAQEALQQALVLQRAVDAGQARLAATAGPAPREVVESLQAWTDRFAQAVWERLGTNASLAEPPARAFRRLRVEMLDAERAVVVAVHRSGVVAAEVLEAVLERLDQEEAMLSGFTDEDAVSSGDTLRAPPEVETCVHLREAATVVVPLTPEGCQECLAEGRHDWVALRMCLGCGHVGCCDSSPSRHADVHHDASGHPVMRSFELGEAWRWCYLDRSLG